MHNLTIVLLISGTFFANAVEEPALLINEFVASNSEGIQDEDGDHEDWIEIRNIGTDAIELKWYGLTDREGDFHRWVFPDTTIQPGAFMIVWASGKDRRIPGKPLHTSFRIAQSGEPLRLSDVQGNMLDTVPPVYVPTDYSYGRYADETGDWVFFDEPTPGKPNGTSHLNRILQPPAFSHEPGYYDAPFDLTLSLPDDADGAEIYYTTDGSDPGPENGTMYAPGDSIRIENRTEEPNDISMIPTNNIGPDHQYSEGWEAPSGQVFKGNVIRAVTIAESAEPAGIATNTYLVGNELEKRYRFPVVSLATNWEHFFSEDKGIYAHRNFWNRGSEWERPVHFEFFNTDGERLLAQDAGTRIHGGTSRSRPVKSLRMYARRSYGETWFEHPLIPEAPVDIYKRFLLRNSGNDWRKSYFRDALMQKLVQHTEVETQYYQPAVVFINGVYWGLKNMRTRYDHRYFETMYDINRDDLVHLEGNAEIKEGVQSDSTAYRDLRDRIDDTDTDMEDPEVWKYFTNRIDMGNLRDYYIANIYFRNTDWPGNNIDFWRKRTDQPSNDGEWGHDGRWRWLLYDTDFGFNLDYNYVQGYNQRARHNTLKFAVEGGGGGWPNPQWSVKMIRGALRNPEFKQDFINRFADLLNTSFSEDRVVAEIDRMYQQLEPHMEEHIRRWNGPESMQNWNQQVESMREFGKERPDAQREHILSFFHLEGLMRLELDVSDPQAGFIRVNSVDINTDEPGIPNDPWPWTGTYFRGVPVTITAIPAEGYEFAGWKESDTAGKTLKIESEEEIYRVTAMFKGVGVSAEDNFEDEDKVRSFRVDSPRPNPFNNETMLTFELPEAQHVNVSVYSVDGRRVATYHDQQLPTGRHSLRIDFQGRASGVYVVVLKAGPHQKTLPVTLIK